MTQYSINKGLKEFGKLGADDVMNELRQLDEQHVIEPRSAQMLTGEENIEHCIISCF
jgi:hypothetical protein